MLLSVEHVTKRFADNLILDDINLTVEDQGRYGLIGVNGAGKSTLLKILLGELEADEGEVARGSRLSVGYLAQNAGLERTGTIWEEMRSVFADVWKAEAEMRRLETEMAALADHTSDAYRTIAAEYARRQNYFDSRDGYQIDVKIKTILNGMGFMDKERDTVISTLSGGEKTRLAIAKLLLEEPNLLILDEPTNHLDFKTLNWLEEYLTDYNGAILVVSHDRYFLDKIVNHIFEIERTRLYTYKGNYSQYLVSKEERRIRQEKEYEAQQQLIAQLQTYVDKNIARASTANSAKSRLKTLEKLERIEKPEGDIKQIKLKFEMLKEPYKDVLTVENLDVCVGEERRTICKGISLSVKRGEKIAIIGENGVGKSSFFKTILGIIPPGSGYFQWGKNTSVSYYEQENLNLNPDNLAIDELWNRFPRIPEAKIRRVLGNVRLTREDVYKPVKVISGGERAKLAFCIIMLEKANVILLDEPTNHLDLPSKEILEQALLAYEGTLLFISHDRYLLNKVPDKIVELTRDGATIYEGNYAYYKERSAAFSQAQTAARKESAAEKPRQGGYRSKEQRRLEAQRKQRIQELEAIISETEAENATLEAEMATEAVYTDYVAMQEKSAQLDKNQAALDACYEEWERLQEEME